jgi:hypothetical protein
MLMTNETKNTHKKLKIHALVVSIVLVAVTITFGVLSFVAALSDAYVLGEMEAARMEPVDCGISTVGVDENVDENADENLLGENETLISPEEEEALINEKIKNFDGCDAIDMERDILYEVQIQSILTRMHLTITILLVATVVSFLIDIAYFSTLRLSVANLFKK